MRTVFRSSLLTLLLAFAWAADGARATERPGDALYREELEQHGQAVGALEAELTRMIATAPDELRFGVYWSYDQLVGAWMHVDDVQTLLDRAAAASMPAELSQRTLLRTHAQFVHWQLGQAGSELAQAPQCRGEGAALRACGAVRRVLADVQATIGRLLADQ